MKKFLFPLVGLVVIFRLSVFAQHFEWSTSGGYVGVANSFDGAFDIARDLNGNLYILNNGNQDQQCQGDTVQPIQSGNMSTFVHKFDATGNLQWIVPIGPSFQPYGIEVDESGNVYVLGRISNNTITVDDTTVNTTASVNYLVKLNSNGEYIWHRNTGMQGTGGLGRTTLLKYASGTLYFQSGNTNLAAIDTANQPITSLSATFYDPETAFPNIWIKNAATFSNGDLLFVGEHQGKLSFGSDTLPVNAQDATLERYFYIRCTPALQVVWFQSFGSFKSTFQFPIGVCIDNEDNVYSSVLLTFNTPVKFGPDSVFNSTLVNGIGGFIKINSSGNPIWLRTIESGQTTNPYGLVWTHDNTGFWNAGVYAGSVNFGNINLNASNDGKGFIAKMDTAGNFVKAYSCGKPSVLPNALQSFAYSLASNGNGKYYVGGYLNTSTNYIKSCNSYTHNKGFFLSAFTGEPDTIFKPTITQNGNVLIASPEFSGEIKWYLNGSEIIGENSSTLTVNQSGNYSVSYTYNTGCVGSDTSSVVNVTLTGIKKLFSMGLSIKPNPSNGLYEISGLENTQKNITAEIKDVLGATIKQTLISKESPQLDIQFALPGIYFVQLNADDEAIILKVMKQ